MKSGLDYFLDQVRTLVKSKPPYNAAFTTQALYLLNQSVTIMQGLQEVHKKQKIEIDSLKEEVDELKPRRMPTDQARNAEMIEDHKAGLTVRAIAKKHGITAGRVCQILLKLGVRNAGPPRVKRLSNRSDQKRQGVLEVGEAARDPSDADRIRKDGNGGGSDRLGSGEGQTGDLYGSGDQSHHTDDRELPA